MNIRNDVENAQSRNNAETSSNLLTDLISSITGIRDDSYLNRDSNLGNNQNRTNNNESNAPIINSENDELLKKKRNKDNSSKEENDDEDEN